MTKKRGMIMSLLVLIGILLSSGIASAEGPPPPGMLPTPRPWVPQGTEVEEGKHLPPPDMYAGESSAAIDAVSLGSPGFVFRYVDTFGVTEEGYPVSTAYLNRPNGLYIDGSDFLYVTEENGCRVLVYGPTGTHSQTLGTAGVCYSDGTIFSGPDDVTRDGLGNIWVADRYHRVLEYDSGGSLMRTLPEENSWESGSDNTHFDHVTGVAFDSSGRMYVVDRFNHRVQVYTFSVGDPVYHSTIGETGVSGSDNSHFNEPWNVIVDSSDTVYIVDRENHRVQSCAESTGWSCATFDSGLNYPDGIDVDGSDNVYIADSGNNRVRKCTSGGTCSDFITGIPGWMGDVAVDSSGNVFISDWTYDVVYKYDSTPVSQGIFVGTVDTPYVADTTRIYTPGGIALAPDGSIYVTERLGYRLLKLNAAGVQQWAVGEAGVYGDDNAHFGDYWGGPEGSIALDSSGKIYVPDLPNHRVQIFNSNGTYNTSFGTYGTGNYEFDGPSAVAIHPVSGDIFIADVWNHRVQVYDSSRVYKATLGTTGVSGSDAAHFNSPQGIAVDAGSNVYVSDTDNHRVQVCTVIGSGGTCSTFAGQSGDDGWDFDHLAGPYGLAVDLAGNVYVLDRWNDRLQIFNSAGAYLTTIGGSWGSSPGQLRGSNDVAVDSAGNVYITDSDINHRIQKYSPGVEGWEQVNINGFGDRLNNGVLTLANFDGDLYAGTMHDDGAEIWSSSDGLTWSSVMTGGFGDSTNHGIDHLFDFGGNLYAGTWNNDDSNGGELWRSADGSTWNPITTDGFGDSTNAEIYRLAEFNSNLYASTWSWDAGVQGGELWRSATGNSGSWSIVVDDGFGDSYNGGILSFEEFSGYFYAGTANSETGGEIWRSVSGDNASWTQVNSDGFGDSGNGYISALAAFDGYLYAATRHASGSGSEIWRCQSCDGTDWGQVVFNGFGDAESRRNPGFEIYNGHLYIVVTNYETGPEVWRTLDGTTWTEVGVGFGDSNNIGYWDNSNTVFDGYLYVGFINYGNGGEVWQLQIPEMDIQGGGQSIVDGDSTPALNDDTDFGNIDISSGSVSHTFTVENTGDGPLYLLGTPKVEISGLHAFDFTVTSLPTSPVASGGTTTFEITFDPGITGLREAEVSIANDDLDENPYTFAIQGTGTESVIDDDKIGMYSRTQKTWYLKDANVDGWGGITTVRFGSVDSSWIPVVGDWNGNGTDTIGMYSRTQKTWYLKGGNTDGWGDVTTVRFGSTDSSWIPVVGDWDGDGTDTIGMYSRNQKTWYLKGANVDGWGGVTTVRFGSVDSSWIPVVGDWNGDGTDTIGMYSRNQKTWYLKGANVDGWGGVTTVRFGSTDSSWLPVVGDWDGNGTDTIAMYSRTQKTWYLKDANIDGWGGVSTVRFGSTDTSWIPATGKW